MTREEALAKDKTLLEISDRVRKLPAMVVNYGGDNIFAGMVNRDAVLSIVDEYGFNDGIYISERVKKA